MSLFEGYERRIDKINGVLKEYGISSVEECKEICLSKGVDCDKIVRGTQPICFENAVWAYTVGAAIAIKKGCKKASRRGGGDRYRSAGVLRSRFCGAKPSGRSGPRQSRRDAPFRRNGMLLLPCGTRIVCGGGRRDFHCSEREQSEKESAARYSERSRQRRGVYHFENQRFHVCGNEVRSRYRNGESGV